MDIELLKSEVKKIFEEDASGHDFGHTVRVYNNAMKIADNMECDKELVALASLLHDVDDEKLFKTADYANARRIMNTLGVDKDIQQKIVDIISQVSFKGNESTVPTTIEGCITQDADRLDAIGAIGIARTFAYGGSKGHKIYDPAINPNMNMSGKEYLKGDGTSLNHFYEKLFLLKDMMNTEYAKELANKRDLVMHSFVDEFNREVSDARELGKDKDKGRFLLLTREGKINYYSKTSAWMKKLIKIAANRVLYDIRDEEIEKINEDFFEGLKTKGKNMFTSIEWRAELSLAMKDYKEVLSAFLSAHKGENANYFEEICDELNKIEKAGDKSNGSVDSSLCSSKRALIVDAVEKVIYRNYHLTDEQKEAYNAGYIYIHDMGHRRDSINCCLFDMENVLNGGFEMGEMWYEEPKTLAEAFDVIGSVALNGAAQIYGGFTIPQIDEILVKYAKKSRELYISNYKKYGVDDSVADKMADDMIEEDFKNGFFSLEEKFNSIISPRGDYPFITITFGIGRDKYAQMATKAALNVRKTGHGTEGHKKPVLFPKLVFLFDEKLHKKGGELYSLFMSAIECSSKVMYPEYLSLTGEKGIVSHVYKKYGKVISPMCCRAFLTEWFREGKTKPKDENDEPVFIGRFNFGVISLNIPMILAKSMEEKTDFYEELDYYLEIARQIHISTYKFLAKKKAHTNPLMFMQGGLYGGTLGRDDDIEPLLESATASFGFTALNEVQRLKNGKSLVEDGQFALDTLKHINDKVKEFQEEDNIQYSVYGTPAESLCGRQLEKFREKFGIIENVSDREYFSNSFHCHVSEDIDPIEKQEYESRFWDLADGGKIQYIRFTVPHNVEALEAIVTHAMELGLYEGINMSLAYCNNCGFEWRNDGKERPTLCPECKDSEMTMIERMCGYIAYTRVHGTTRLNKAKMAEIGDRISM